MKNINTISNKMIQKNLYFAICENEKKYLSFTNYFWIMLKYFRI